jgi:glycosyltransferase involved in cell wall biosynthesis
LLRRNDVHLLVVGDGPEHEHLAALAHELTIADQVHFLGFVKEEKKYQLLANADIYAMPSLHEGFGLVYLEGMHCGLPIIAATRGGQTEFLEDGKTGFLVPVRDVKALHDALARLVNDSPLRNCFGDANQKRVRSYYVSRTARLYESLFDETLRGARAS